MYEHKSFERYNSYGVLLLLLFSWIFFHNSYLINFVVAVVVVSILCNSFNCTDTFSSNAD